MSSDIWTRCAGVSEVAPLRLEPWRVVEAQHLIATRKLVDTDEEQLLLEQLIDGAKPPTANGLPPGLHYLLSTPFRYPPLPHGSRFGKTTERGIWYGSLGIDTALAESAYYRLLFLEGTEARLGAVRTKLNVYRARLKATHGVDLSEPPFREHEPAISSPSRYRASQALGTAMRAGGVQAFAFVSARDPRKGLNVGVFDPQVFKGAKPKSFETWHSSTEPAGVEFRKLDYFDRIVTRFDREVFSVNGALPTPAP